MKRLKIVLFIIMISVFVAGCSGGTGNSNDNLSQDNVIEKAEISFDKLKSTSQESRINLIFDMEDNQDTQEIELDAQVIYDSKHNPETVLTKTKSVFGDEVTSFDFYKDSGSMLINDGQGWVEYNSSENYGTTYKPILDTFLNVAKDFVMEETDTSYKFTFTGKDGNIYRTVGTPYNFQYTGIADDDIELDIIYVIEKENMFLDEMAIKTRGVIDDKNNISINASTDFDDFNEVKIEKPDLM